MARGVRAITRGNLTDSSSDTIETAGKRRRPRWSLAGIALAVIVPAVPIVAGFIITSGSSRAGTVSGGAFKSVSQTTASTPVQTKHPGDRLPPGKGELVALLLHSTTMRG